MLLTAAPPALGGGCASGAGQGTLRFVTVGLWPNVPHSSAPGPWWQVCFRCGPRALRFVTVGLWPNVPHSSAPALGGGCISGAGHGRCVSSRLACGQMLLTAAPWPLGRVCFECGPRALRFVTVGLRPNVSHSSAPGPWWRVCFRRGPRALCFVTVGLWPNAPQSSAPAHSTRISKQIFHKEYSQC